MTVWTWLWIAWLVLVVGGFFAIEIPAIRNGIKEDTLSEHLRRWFSTHTKRGKFVWIAFVMLLVGVLLWLVVHIAVVGSV